MGELGSDHYDLIVIGSGPGGASVAQRLASSGKRILVLERRGYLSRSEKNWNSQIVFADGTYQANETWTNA
jgi:choline dehydrogenase-like flavoprotein